MNKQSRRLTRDMKNRRIAGVCAGIARYFSLEIWVVRLITFGAVFFSASLVVFAYFSAWLIMERDDREKVQPNSEHYVDHDTTEDSFSVDIKENTWRSGEPPKQALQTIAQGYQKLEDRIQQIEKHVTSHKFQIEREINKL